jgi:hypothetical protein
MTVEQTAENFARARKILLHWKERREIVGSPSRN